MGAYLSEPVTEKFSEDDRTERLSFGASSMQGWRVTQEDRHNCILDFDDSSSLFAVYDGHGGVEVAHYCAAYLPDYIKSTKSYKDGNLAQALEDAFVDFDSTLVTESVLKELGKIAGIEKEPLEEDEDEVDHLYEEAHIPLEDLLAKYKSASAIAPHLRHLKSKKPQSPYLRAKKETESTSSSCESSNEAAGTSSSSSSSVGTSSASVETSSCSVGSSSASRSVVENDNPDDREAAAVSSPTVLTSEADSVIVKNDAASPTSSSSAVKRDVGSDSSPAVVNGSDEVIPASSSTAVDNSGDNVVVSSDTTTGATNGGDGEKPEEVCSTTPSLSGGASIGKGKGGKGKGKSLMKNASVIQLGSGDSSKTSTHTFKTPTRKCFHRQARPLVMEDKSDGSESEETDEEYEGQVSEPGEDEDDEEEEEQSDDDEEDEDDDDEEDEEEDEDDDDDVMQMSDKEEPGYDSGCTACVCLLVKDVLYVANAGDSRCVVCRNGVAIEMSHDHKPEDELEHKRIVNAGGKVTMDGRVNGGLNLSRAIGDHSYKKNDKLSLKEQMISPLPDIRTLTVDPDEDEFMIIACDGIWNFMSSQDVVTYVRERINKAENLSSICEELFDHCLSPTTMGDGTGCDNMTCIIVKFKTLPKTFPADSAATTSGPVKRSVPDEDDDGGEQESSVSSSSKKVKIDLDNPLA